MRILRFILVAITLAVITKKILVSLSAGVFVGALIVSNGNPFLAIFAAVDKYIWGSLADELNLRVMAFTLMMG